MFEVQHITSFDLPELAPYRTLKLQAEQRQQGIFVVESEKVTRRLLASKLEVVSVILPETLLPDFAEALNRRSDVVKVYCAPKAVLETLTGYYMYQGILGIGRMPAQPTVECLLEKKLRKEDDAARSSLPLLLVAADGIANSQNMGVLVRNSAGFSADGLLVAENSCSPFLRRAVSASMGTIFEFPAVEVSLAETLKVLRTRGVRCVAAHPHVNEKTISDTDFTVDCCVVFGSEGQGIRPEILKLCDEAVTIPMAGNVDSLNVGSASAVFLYEVARQRGTNL
jgi:tRNA G18 (ribose-2'-O)-methylase SpoU